MKKRFWWLLQILCFAICIGVGGWFRLCDIGRPLPLSEETADTFVSARCVETFSTEAWTGLATPEPSLFHWVAARCATFVSSKQQGLSVRSYRLFPAIASVLFLALIPLLGLRRRGGLFETSDGPLWAMAFAALSPVLMNGATPFGPFSVLLLSFLLLLLLARAYAQWPSFVSAIFIGLLFAVALAIDVDMLWVLVVLIPTVIVGVGWTRLCLYWRTWHCVAMVGALGTVVGWLIYKGQLGCPSLPSLPVHDFGWRTLWVCSGGLGVVAWIVLAILSGYRAERRWMRVLVMVFPACFVGSLFFPHGGIFAVPLACLTPLMMGVAVSGLTSPWKRGLMGGLLVAVLLCSTIAVQQLVNTAYGTRREQRIAVRQLRAMLQTTQAQPLSKVFIFTTSPADAFPLLWPLRYSVPQMTIASQLKGATEADVLIVQQGDSAQFHDFLATRASLGQLKMGTRRFEVFTKLKP